MLKEHDDDDYIFVCRTTDLSDRGKRFFIKEKPIDFFYESKTNSVYAIDDACPHQGVSLVNRQIRYIDDTPCISCPAHLLKFQLTTGNCLANPKFNQTMYPIKVIDDDVFIKVDISTNSDNN